MKTAILCMKKADLSIKEYLVIDFWFYLFIYLKNGALETAREICYFLRGRKIQGATFSLYD